MPRSTSDSLRLDDLDRQIIALLAGDARTSFAAIGDEIGLSAPAVKRRVDRLVEQGAIRGFTVMLDPAVAGGSTEAFIEIWCRPRTSPAELARVATAHPQVVAAYTVAGEADAILHVQTQDMPGFEAVLEHLRADEHIERTRSVIVLSRLVMRPPLPSPP